MGRKYQLNCSFSDGSTKSAGSFEIPDGEPALVYGAIVPQIPTPVVNIALPVSGFNRTPVIGDVVNIVCGTNGRSGIAIGKITAVDSTNATCNITSFVETTGATSTNTVKTAEEWASDNPVLAAGEIGYDTTNKITKIGDGVTAWNRLNSFVTQAPPTFANASWAEIAKLSESGAASTFSVGDEKTIELSTGEEVTLVILGFNHDDLSDGSGKAGMTIGMKNLLSTQYSMNATSTNYGGWYDCEMRTSTMATLLSQLPADLQSVIKQVKKQAFMGNESGGPRTCDDKLWLLATEEIDGKQLSDFFHEGKQYEYWKTVKDGTANADRIKYLSNGNDVASAWWLRSTPFEGATFYYYIAATGVRGTNIPTQTRGVSFCFCV